MPSQELWKPVVAYLDGTGEGHKQLDGHCFLNNVHNPSVQNIKSVLQVLHSSPATGRIHSADKKWLPGNRQLQAENFYLSLPKRLGSLSMFNSVTLFTGITMAAK